MFFCWEEEMLEIYCKYGKLQYCDYVLFWSRPFIVKFVNKYKFQNDMYLSSHLSSFIHY
jgi:hypothetical protein